MVEFLIKTGIDSITVSPENTIKVKNLAEKIEKKLLLEIARRYHDTN